VADIESGVEVDTYFMIVSKKTPRSYNNKPGCWFSLEVSDKTGRIKVVFWGDSDESTRALHSSLREQDVVRIRGTASLYHDILQISVNPGVGALEPCTTYDKEDIMPATDLDIGELRSNLFEEIMGIQNGPLRSLLESIFEDKEVLERYTTWPAARRYHHAYTGGLIEHSLNLVRLARTEAKHYEPHLDTDMLTAGCLLHDIGKIYEYEVGIGITYSATGNYLGHITTGAMLVRQHIEKLRQSHPDAIDVDTEQHILHIILSHHGILEHGSPVEPQTPEAVLVHHVDACDAQTKHVLQDKIASQNPSS